MSTTLTIEILTNVAKAVAGIDSVDKKTSGLAAGVKSAALGIGAALSVDKIVSWGKEWLAAGLDANRALNDTKRVFGESAEGVNAWGEKASTTFGTTAADAEKMASKVGIALEGFGASHQLAAKESEALVQRSAELAKVLGTDTESVLTRVEAAMRGRTAGLKDYGVEVAKGSDSTAIFNAFMDQTGKAAGAADTKLGTFHATMGDLSATLGQALVPVLMAVLPLFNAVGNWAKEHKGPFTAIVLVIAALALIFGIATAAASAFAIAQLAALWPILLVVAAVAALIAIIAVVIHYWSDLVGWFHTAEQAVLSFGRSWGGVLLLFAGPIGIAIAAIANFGRIWGVVEAAIHGVEGAVHAVMGAVNAALGAFEKLGGVIENIVGKAKSAADFIASLPGKAVSAGGKILSAINPFLAPPSGGASASPYGTTSGAVPVTFAPSITITGDVGDPVLAGRRIVSALEAWTQANGRRRIAALVGP